MGTLCLYISPAACALATWIAPWSRGQQRNGLSLAEGKTYMIPAAVSRCERFQISGRPSSPGLASASFSFLLLLFSTLNQHIHRNNPAMKVGVSLGHDCCASFFAPCGEDTGPETPNSTPIQYPGCGCISKSRAESTGVSADLSCGVPFGMSYLAPGSYYG